MILSITICFAALLVLLWVVRIDRVSLGLPIAYLALLLLNHVPGAYAHVVGPQFLRGTELVAIGIRFTAIGAVCFVIGVALARLWPLHMPVPASRQVFADRRRFWLFCLMGGWAFTYGLSPLRAIPSLGAAIDKGGAIWMLGVMLGLRAAVQQRDVARIGVWLAALVVYPILMLLFGGFLSYGSAAIIIVISILAVSTRRQWKVIAAILLVAFLSMSLFVNYFGSRKEMRRQVWGGASLEERIDANLAMFKDFKWFDPGNRKHLSALDQRLNQNLFVGLAAKRIEGGQVKALHGRSVRDALFSVVPRAVWPDKPVYGGSPAIVSEMTGVRLDPNTSFGVGNVMEFQVNFRTPGVVFGFLILGFLIGILDRKAAEAEANGDLQRTILFFLPGVCLIQPIGSMVELSGGAAAALVAALGWRWAWAQWSARGSPTSRRRVDGGPVAPPSEQERDAARP